MAKVAALLSAVLAIAGGLAACGEDGDGPGAPEDATLVLDFQPNAVHAPLYAAVADGAMADAGIELDLREPSGTSDGAKLLQSGRADFAILDINDFGIARERGAELVALAAIAQRPLAAVIAADPDGDATPAELDGETVGITGVPSDDAVLDTVLESAGLAPDAVERVSVGFNAAQALASGRVAAVTGFWNAEGVVLRELGVPTREFRVDEFGAPRYPELVLAARGDRAPQRPRLACSLLTGLAAGYRTLEADPEAALEALLDQSPALDRDSQRAQFAQLTALDAFSPRDGGAATPSLHPRAVRGWLGWAVEHDLIDPGHEAEIARSFLPSAPARCGAGRHQPRGGDAGR